MSLIAVGIVFSFAFAVGDVAKGKVLFNDPEFAGGTSGKSCNSCHPDGKGLEKAGTKKEKSLEEAVNMCIENALEGKAIDTKSQDMEDIVAYIKSLAEPAKESSPEEEKQER